jgi:hypothetical protein
MNNRQQKIVEALDQLSMPEPPDVDDGLWYCDRTSPDYWRYSVPDVDGPAKDVWLETEVGRDNAGVLQVRADVVLFDIQGLFELERRAIVSQQFDGHQPREQAFILNAPTYQQQINDGAIEFYEQAVSNAHTHR